MGNKLKQPLFLAAFAHLALEAGNNFLPVVYPLFIANLGLDFGQVGVIALVAVVGGSITQPVFGYLTDRWGPVTLTAVSVTWTGMVMGLVGFSRHYWVLLLVVGLGAIGSAAFHPPGTIVASASRSARRGAAVSIFSVGGNLGSALSPVLVGIGLRWFGLPGTIVLMPVGLLSGLFLYTQLKRHYAPPPESVVSPATIVAAETPVSASTTSSSSPNPPAEWLARHSVRVGLTLVMLIVMTRSWFQMSFTAYLPLWLEGEGRSLTAAGQIFSLFLISISFGSLSGGILSDSIGRWQVVGLSTLSLGVAHAFLLGSVGWMQPVWVGLIGVSIGASFPVTIVLAYELWPKRAGMAASLVMGLGWLPGGIGASVTGQIADRYSLQTGLQTLILPLIFGMVCIAGYVALLRHIQRPTLETTA